MRRHIHHARSSVSPDRLHGAITDIRRWPERDSNLEWTRIGNPAAAGHPFALKLLWDRLVARKQAADAPARTRRLIDFAEAGQ